MTDCIFCKIVAGEIPSFKVYEDDQVLAFLDITQVTPGHTLVIPKEHVRNVLEMKADAAAQLFSCVPKLARQLTDKLGARGLNILNNNEALAGQTVFHAHIHLLPRFGEDDGLRLSFESQEPDTSKLADLAKTLYLEDKS